MNPSTKPDSRLQGPCESEIVALASLCSSQEWDRLIVSHGFLAVAQRSLSDTEAYMTRALGRTISLTKPAAKKSGDHAL